MKSFKKIDECYTSGGQLIIVKNDIYRDFNNNKRDFSDLYPKVKIDRVVYTVKGIESYATPALKKGSPLGILIK